MTTFRPRLSYPVSEKLKIDALEGLFQDWHQHFAVNGPPALAAAADHMVWDGFYPHYFDQKKILFIGRESRDIAGHHNMDVLFEAYRKKRIGDHALDNDRFHARMIHIAYGISHGMPNWQDIPDASSIAETFGERGGLSFAFMNISKLTNERRHFASNHAAINMAYVHSTQDRNFIQEEVCILDPEIIITMNLGKKIFSLGQLTELHRSSESEAYKLICGGKERLLINTWHFSWWCRKDIEGYYAPICEAVRRHETS